MPISRSTDLQELERYFSRVLPEALEQVAIDPLNHLHLQVKKNQFNSVAQFIAQDPSLTANFITMLAFDDPQENASFKIELVFGLPEFTALLRLSTFVEKDDPVFPCVSSVITAAEWHEQEIYDLFGLRATDSRLEPLVLHRDWPRGNHYPFRKAFSIDESIPIAEIPHQFEQPHAEGMHQVAVGPIHARDY